MKIDALARRVRFAPPSPKAGRIVMCEADYRLFEAIDRHGPLPTRFLYEFTKELRKDYTGFQKRLTDLYNGDRGGNYLSRPASQFNSIDARYQDIVYGLAPRGILALGTRRVPYQPNHTNWFVHGLMGACVAASIELATPEGLTYVPRNQVLSDAPAGTHALTNPMAFPLPGSRKLIPDDLFALQNGDAKKLRFAVEIDRNTESIRSSKLDQNDLGKKIENYLDIMRHNRAPQHWGFSRFDVLIVTTNAGHARNIVEYIAGLKEPKYGGRFFVACTPCFSSDEHWRMPKELFTHLMTEPWLTVDGPKHLT